MHERDLARVAARSQSLRTAQTPKGAGQAQSTCHCRRPPCRITGQRLLLVAKRKPAVVVAPPVGTVADHLHHRRLELPVRQFHLIKHTELLIMVPHCSARSHKTAEPFARVRKFNITGFRRYSSGTAREKYRRNGIFAWRIALHCGGLH